MLLCPLASQAPTDHPAVQLGRRADAWECTGHRSRSRSGAQSKMTAQSPPEALSLMKNGEPSAVKYDNPMPRKPALVAAFSYNVGVEVMAGREDKYI
jgi:hypothetical protein